ncbi:uncharacterized protein LOC135313258 [Phalacrocorax carbo]|uniref:uncharacterized protein LOC135313258 n=1 Tax=Phalacrocorax carbo TaxID=9209 RepID=UPI00311A5641
MRDTPGRPRFWDRRTGVAVLTPGEGSSGRPDEEHGPEAASTRGHWPRRTCRVRSSSWLLQVSCGSGFWSSLWTAPAHGWLGLVSAPVRCGSSSPAASGPAPGSSSSGLAAAPVHLQVQLNLQLALLLRAPACSHLQLGGCSRQQGWVDGQTDAETRVGCGAPRRSRAACAAARPARDPAPGWGQPRLRPPGDAARTARLQVQLVAAPGHFWLWFQVQLHGQRQLQLMDGSDLFQPLFTVTPAPGPGAAMDSSDSFQLLFMWLQLILTSLERRRTSPSVFQTPVWTHLLCFQFLLCFISSWFLVPVPFWLQLVLAQLLLAFCQGHQSITVRSSL